MPYSLRELGSLPEATRVLVEHTLGHLAARTPLESRREAAPRVDAEQRAVRQVGAASL